MENVNANNQALNEGNDRYQGNDKIILSRLN